MRYLEDVFLPIDDVAPGAMRRSSRRHDRGPPRPLDVLRRRRQHPGREPRGRETAACARSAWSTTSACRTTYVPEFLAAVRALPRIEGLTVLTGVEAKILDATARVDAPPEVLASLGTPRGPDRVLLADHQVPGPDGPWSPRATRERIVGGPRPGRRGRDAGHATIRAMHARRAGPAGAPVLGPAQDRPERGRRARPAARRARGRRDRDGHAVEVNEKWQCPARGSPTAARRRGAARRVDRRAQARRRRRVRLGARQ